MFKKTKKSFNRLSILVMMIVMCLLVNIITPVMAADAVSDKEYLNAIALLEKLGILIPEDEMIYSEENITRGDFASVLGVFFGISRDANGAISGTSSFDDVDSSSADYSAIDTVVKDGIMDNVNAASFKPNKEVTVESVAKAMAILLGYRMINNESSDSYYLKQANNLGLLSQVKTSYSKPITKGELVSVLIKTLETDVIKIKSFGKIAKYNTENGYSLMRDRFGVVCIQGILQATSKTGIKTYDACCKNTVYIDGYSINTDMDLNDYLGMEMVAYCTVDKDEYELLYCFENSKKNKRLEVDFADVEKVNGNTLYYNTDKRLKTIKIPRDATIIYNGMNCPLYSFENFVTSEKRNAGNIIFLDADNNSYYETIFIKSYQTVWVDRVYNNEGVISLIGMDGTAEFEFDINDDNKYFKFIKNEYEATVNDITPKSIVLIARDQHEENYEFIISNQSLEGLINRFDEEEIRIDDETYKVSRCFDNINNYLKVGNYAIFYFDGFGNVSAVEYAKIKGESYGILERKMNDEDNELDVSMKIYTPDGVHKIFKCAEKIKIDAKRYKLEDVSAIDEALKNGKTQFFVLTGMDAKGTGDYYQLIKYQLNSDGEIVSVDTVNKDAIPSDNELKYSEKLNTGLNNFRWFDKSYAKTFNGRYVYDDNLLIFALPDDKSLEEAYSVKKGSMNVLGYEHFSQGSEPKALHIFDVEDDVLIPIMLLETKIVDSVDRVEGINMMVFEKLVYALDENDEAYYVMKGTQISTGSKCDVNMTEEVYTEQFANMDINAGDVVRWTVDSMGRAKIIERTVKNEGKDSKIALGVEPNIVYVNDTGYYSTTRVTCGLVEFFNDKYILFKYGDEKSASLINPSAKVLVYDKKTKTTITGDYSMIRTTTQNASDPTLVVTYQENSAIKSLVIFK